MQTWNDLQEHNRKVNDRATCWGIAGIVWLLLAAFALGLLLFGCDKLDMTNLRYGDSANWVERWGL